MPNHAKKAQKELALFNKNRLKIEHSQHNILHLKKWRNRLDITALLANVSQILAGIISFSITEQSGESGPKYFKITDLINRFCQSWGMVLQALGQAFAFIGYAANGFRAMWDLGVTGYRWAFRNAANKIALIQPHDAEKSLASKHVLLGRTVANVLLIVFNIIAVLTVIGLFTTGLGLVLAATASAIGWVKDSFIPWWKVRKELAETKQELILIDKAIENSSPQDLPALTFQREMLQEQSSRLNEEYKSYRTGMILGAVSIIAFALFATGPFGLATLSMIGSVLLVACTFIGVGRVIYNACRQQNDKNSEHEKLRINTESELEFRHKNKMDHWMSSTHLILKAKISNPASIAESQHLDPTHDASSPLLAKQQEAVASVAFNSVTPIAVNLR